MNELRKQELKIKIAIEPLQKATTRSDIHLKDALETYETYIEEKLHHIEGLIVRNDPQSMCRIEDAKLELAKASNDKNGALFSMAEDMKQATVRGKAIQKVMT